MKMTPSVILIRKKRIFKQIFTSLFTRENLGSIPRLNQRYFDLPLSDCVIDEEEVLKALEKLDVFKSPGPDGIHNKVY